jgi:YD repeat-containing protein
LTVINGAFQLRELDGSLTAFHTNGSLDFVQDRNGNRITAGYTGTLLTSLTHSDGDALTFTYNAQGRIKQVRDPAGRTVTYGYDVSGEHLTDVTSAAGTTTYTYTPEASGPRAHALASIETPLGTHQFFTYDSHGRIQLSQNDAGAKLAPLPAPSRPCTRMK